MLINRISLQPVVIREDNPELRELQRALLAVVLAVLAVVVTAALWTAARAAPAPSAVTSSAATSSNVLVTSLGRRRSHNGHYAAEVVSTSPMAIGTRQSWTVHLSRRTHRVSHATVAADVGMPETAERSPIQPSVRYVGGGNYRIDDLVFSRPGWWNVGLVISGRRGTDSVAFNVVLPPVRRVVSPATR